MTLQEALTILTTHQQWRRGADIQMAEPKVITEALDVVLAYHHVGTNEMIKTNKTMTAVEWLIDAMENPHKHNNIKWENVKQQVKEMEKQQIIDAFNQGYREGWIDSISGDCTNDQDVETFEDANLYYTSTYEVREVMKTNYKLAVK